MQVWVWFSAVAAYTNALKESIKSQTEFHAPTKSNVRTDDIFTNLLMQHGRKSVEDHGMKRKEHLRHYGQVSGKPVKHCQEIFMIPADGNVKHPESILVTGKAGIGKTLFCQKMIRDWADDKLFLSIANANVRDFKFAYLLTFRQLNLLRDKRVTLRDILNQSSLLDDHSNIDDSLFEYIVDHSDEVLIVIDGYDEYSQQNFIASDLDEEYPNNAKEKMPAAALCAKLMKRQILRGSVVMITSRPDESDKMMQQKKIDFDRYVEITGFSEPQVKEYIEKYFKDNERMKNNVLDHITKNDNLISFAHVPVLCFLMCSYFEYILNETKNTDALPVKTSDLYFEVVNIFVQKHDKKKKLSLEDTLAKLSELAVQLLLEKRFLFVKETMQTFSSQEIDSLVASGLLHCGPPFRTSFSSEPTKHFCFTHLTLQEYLAARWFVKRREIPPKSVSTEVFQFMSGILSKQKDNNFMEFLLEQVSKHIDCEKNLSFRSERRKLLMAKCLAEYEDQEFAKSIVKKRYLEFCGVSGVISFSGLTDVDCIAVSFLLDVFSAVNAEEASGRNQTSSELQSHSVGKMMIKNSRLTPYGVTRILKSLLKEFCAITNLDIISIILNDKCADKIAELLPLTKVTELKLFHDEVTDAGVVSLCQALQAETC